MAAGAGPTVTMPRRLRVYTEPAGSFAVDHTGTLGDFSDVPAVEGSVQLTLTQETQNPGQLLQDNRDYQEEIIGKKSWQLTFQIPLYPHGASVAAGSGTTATQSALGILLSAVMGGEYLGKGSTVATGGWASSASGAVATGSGFRAGGAFAWADTSGVVHAREIEQVVTNTITLKTGLPGTPASGDVVYSGATYYWTRDPTTSLQFIAEGDEQQDRWLCMGGQGTFTRSFPIDGTLPMLTFTITGTTWLEGDEAAGAASIHGTSLGTATYSNYNPITGHVGRCLVTTVGTATYAGATVDIASYEASSAFAMTPVPSPSGDQGILRWRLTKATMTAPAEGTFVTYFTGYTNWDARDTKADKAIFLQQGVSTGGIVVHSAPTVQFVDVQSPKEGDVQNESVMWRARNDTDTTETTSSDLGTSPERFHIV